MNIPHQVYLILLINLMLMPFQSLTTRAQTVQRAVVYDPPSNVRATPNGPIICSVEKVTNINIYGSSQGWYVTDVCGTRGYIHQSQVRISLNNNSPAFNAIAGKLSSEYSGSGLSYRIEKFAVVDKYALATFFVGEYAGGTAVAIKRGGQWQVILHGDDWGGIQRFIDNGIPRPIAVQLMDQVFPGWPAWEQ